MFNVNVSWETFNSFEHFLSSTFFLRNMPFLCSKNPHFRNEVKSKTFLVILSFICIRKIKRFHINGFTHSLALKQRLCATRIWSINFSIPF